jgi:AGCS family alanine or glycine:cation symporter
VATVFGWGLYGLRCVQYLFGEEAWKSFAFLQAAAVMAGAVLQTETVWTISEIVNGLMAVPNLIALIWLNPKVVQLCKEYREINKESRRLR